MKTALKLGWNLQQFGGNEDPTGGSQSDNAPQTVTIGDKEYSIEDLQNKLTGYEKLEKQFTKVTQENSELKKLGERAKEWIEFENFVNSYPQEVREQFTQQVNTFFASVQQGNVTQQDVTNINKAIKTAVKAGDDKTADVLKDARDEALQELLLEKEFATVAKQAKKDGLDFDEDHFKDFLAKYLEDEGYGEDDDFDTKEIQRAYKMYKVDLKEKALEEEKKKRLPNVGTGGTGIGVGANKDKSKEPKSLKEAARMARERLGF